MGFQQTASRPSIKGKCRRYNGYPYTNNLSEPATIHWHGICLPASMDGTDAVQKPIEPGEVFEYRFVVKDAGTFWYHAHTNETVQMERGMYGAIIVDGETDPVVDGERILMIDDMKFEENNEFTKPSWFIPRIVKKGVTGFWLQVISFMEYGTFCIH